ncbi:MAG TPA: 30S ribosomal protein S27ae [Methanoregulaceae archaeon]|nr:30S ribosomal protein S27ae [Methanoregulaceae archaeon]
MAAKKGKASKAAKRSSYYKVEGAKATMNRKFCPRCGPGMVMAEHKDRTACGKCGYTEFKK